jgi:hypothetical protein
MVNKKKIIVAKNAPEKAKYKLDNMGYELVESAFLQNVQPPLAYHPDMQIVKCADSYICAPECFEYYSKVLCRKLVCGESVPEYDYPSDIAYNVAVTDKYAIHNFHYTDSVFLDNSPYIHISVKQGYSKCSVCVVSEDAIITSDNGIATAVAKSGVDVLLITPGYVSLTGYDYGLIGGASGLVEDNILCFCGDIGTHPDYLKIDEFCKKHSVEIVSLCDGGLVDVGTIISVG